MRDYEDGNNKISIKCPIFQTTETIATTEQPFDVNIQDNQRIDINMRAQEDLRDSNHEKPAEVYQE